MDEHAPIKKAKAELREEARGRRKRAFAAKANEASQLLAERAVDIIHARGLAAGGVIAGYHPIRDELDCLELLSALRRLGARTALPRMRADEKSLDFHLWDGVAPLEAGAHGVLEPSPDIEPVRPEVILLPLLAFDMRGGRLGYGGGYYDRTLAELRGEVRPLAIGIGFDEQEVDEVPLDENDQSLDYVTTPSRFIKISSVKPVTL